jgi:protein-disulfide isomerase
VSCEQVLESAYGRVFGVPVAAGGAIWSGLVLLLSLYGMRKSATDIAQRAAGYVFVLATIGLAAVFYFAYTSFFVLKQACPLCMTMYVSVAAIFLLSAAAAGSLRDLPRRLGADLAGLRTSPTAATLAAVWVVASLALIVFFPHQQTVSAQAAEQQEAAPTETLDASQLAEWHQWLDRQMPVSEPAVLPTGPVKVLVVKFNDFQCPACRQAYFAYRSIFEKYEKQFPESFKFENKDYPLESECGMGGQHQFACEAAVAVRLAHEKGKDKDLENWLFSTQDEFSRDHVKQGLQQLAGVKPEDYESRYSQVSKEIREQAALGSKLGVTGTPTFFINGVKVPSLRPAYLDAAIAYLLQKAGATS